MNLTKKESSHSSINVLTHMVLAGVVLVGFTVIAGWHLHVRVLVQVFSGVIPMQYNTALCLIVLGASGFLLVTSRVHSFLPALGGAFLLVMGTVVVYEYATGISLGIDTLFFYPWDLTLSAHPGRMALTTAVSFISSGIALILLSLRRHALAAFAILHTLPLSLGLTSALGYLAGITFVLPLQLGSQMAVHTALAFCAYGGVMLRFAWQEAPHTDQGMPKWAPALGILMVPVLFVGIGITAQRNSVLAWALPCLGGLLAAALFAVAAYKLTSSSIKRKGLILVSVPLVFLLVFVIFVTQLSRKSQQAQASYLQSKDAIAEMESISAHLLDAEASIRGYVITGDPAFAQPFEHARQEIPNAIGRLRTLVQVNPVQESRVLAMGANAAEKIAFQAATEQLVRSGAREQAIERIKTAEGLRIMNDFRRLREDFLKEEQRVDLERRLAVQSAWQRFNWLLVAGSTIDVFLAVILAILFSGGISKRVVTLTENAKALADDKPLNEPMRGTDEIAHLDHVFREMAEALRKAAQKERAIFENALDLICSFDSEGRFLKVSPSSFNVWGYRPEELIGRRYTEFLVPEEVEKSEQAEQEILAGKALTNFENCYHRKDGAKINMLWSAWWSETDKVMFAMARDITERKRAEEGLRKLRDELEVRVQERTAELSSTNALLQKQVAVRERAQNDLLESEARTRLIIDTALDAVITIDADGIVTSWNAQAETMFGWPREEAVGRSLAETIVPAQYRAAHIKGMRRFLSTGEGPVLNRRIEITALRRDGYEFPIELAIAPVQREGTWYFSAFVRDITERKKAEEEIKNLNEGLERRVEERTAQLETANKELEAFSYSVSHDLRAPLRAIDGFSRILLEDYADKLDEDGNRVLEVVRTNAQNMGQLIDDLLTFSRLGRKAVEVLPIDMTALAKSAFEEINPPDSERRLQLEIENIPPAMGDRALMRQVFINLLSNATKYSRKKERPLIQVGGRTENGSNLYFVKDNGAGFDMQYANKLFGVFQRLHGPEEFEGTGVGLAIVQRIIHRHGGRVWAESKVNEGATFYFTLPKENDSNANYTKPE